MTKFTILHNPKCSKSRQALQLLDDNGTTPTIIYYLQQPLDAKQLDVLFKKIQRPIRECMRTKEPIYTKLNLTDLSLSDTELIQAISDHPILLERPIVHTNTDAVIGRPPENVLLFIQQHSINR
jgi:arsenate reductase (glutaredoxin)